MHVFSTRQSFIIGLLTMLSLTSHCSAQSTTDIWDVRQGNVVTADSGILDLGPSYHSSAHDMFGATDGNVESGNTLFTDADLAGFTHFVEWRTPTYIRLESFRLYATPDSNANERGFSTFNLLAKNPVTGVFEQIYTFHPTNPYTIIGPNFLLVNASVAPTIAQDFRAEFVQFGDRTPSARGPRILELDGFGVPTAVPEPGAVALLVGAGLSGASLLLRRRHKRVCSSA